MGLGLGSRVAAGWAESVFSRLPETDVFFFF